MDDMNKKILDVLADVNALFKNPTVAHLQIFFELKNAPDEGSTVNALSERTNVKPPSVYRALTSFQEKDLVDVFTIQGQGQQKLYKFSKHGEHLINHYLSSLSA